MAFTIPVVVYKCLDSLFSNSAISEQMLHAAVLILSLPPTIGGTEV